MLKNSDNAYDYEEADPDDLFGNFESNRDYTDQQRFNQYKFRFWNGTKNFTRITDSAAFQSRAAGFTYPIGNS